MQNLRDRRQAYQREHKGSPLYNVAKLENWLQDSYPSLSNEPPKPMFPV